MVVAVEAGSTVPLNSVHPPSWRARDSTKHSNSSDSSNEYVSRHEAI